MQTWIWFNWWTKRQLQSLSLSVFLFQRSLRWSEFSLGFENVRKHHLVRHQPSRKPVWFSAPFVDLLQRCWCWSTSRATWATSSQWGWGMWWKTSPCPVKKDGYTESWEGKKASFPAILSKYVESLHPTEIYSQFMWFIFVLFSLLFLLLAASTSVFNGWRLEGAPEHQKKYNAKLKFSLVSFFSCEYFTQKKSC